MELKITDLLDDYMEEDILLNYMPVPENKRIKEAAMNRIKKNRNIRPLRVALLAAAIVVLLTGTVIGIYYTRISNTLEEDWNALAETEMTQQQKEYVETRSADIGESVTNQGITITIDSVTCTTNAAYLMIHYEFDPSLYDVENIDGCVDRMSHIWVENEEYGIIEADNTSGGGEKKEYGIWMRKTVEIKGIPEGCSLNDGKTTMYVEMTDIGFMREDMEDVEGNWNFSFVLPEADSAETVTVAQEMTFDCGVSLLVSEVAVSESGCSFTVETDTDEYYFVVSEMAELARAAEPDLYQFTVDAELEDGTIVPCTGAHMSLNEETGKDEWNISWAAPLDPDTVKSLIFGDGNSEIWVDLK